MSARRFRRFSFLRGIPLLVVFAWAATARGQGGPPFLTDDPGTPGDRHWEINVAWIHEHRADESADESPLFDLNYGVGERIQLKYEVSQLRAAATGSPTLTGWSNSLAGVKWRFFDDETTKLTISTYPQFEFRNPRSGSVSKGLVPDENALILPIELEKEFQSCVVTVEAGCVRPSKSDSSWFYGVVLGHEFTKTFEAGVELHGECSSSARDSALAALLGARLKLNERFALLGSIGRELHNGLEPKAAVISYLAIQWTP